MRTATMTLTLAAGLSMALAAPAWSQPAYGPQLEGYAYPHAVQRFEFTSQGQPMAMAFMDVAPTGPANGRTAVLLHGKNFCAATWEPTIAVLAREGFRVIALDQIGFCASTKPRGYQFSLPQLADNTRRLLEARGIGKATIIGHSMGGMLAGRLALNHQAMVERLVMVNPLGLEDWQAAGVPYATIDTLYQGELRTSFDSIKAYQQRFYYGGRWEARYDPPVAMLAGMYAGPGKEVVAWNQAQTSEMIFGQPILHEFGRMAVPVTLMIGGADRTAPGANRAPPEIAARLGQYAELGRRAAAAIPGARLVEFPDLGHAPQTEAPERFHAALMAALKE